MSNTLKEECGRLEATNRELLVAVDWCLGMLADYWDSWEDGGEDQTEYDRIEALRNRIRDGLPLAPEPRAMCKALVVSAGRTKELVPCRKYAVIGYDFCNYHIRPEKRIAPKE